MNHIEHTIVFVRACCPVSRSQIRQNLLTQCPEAHYGNVDSLTDSAIVYGTEAGWLKTYDDDKDFFTIG